MSIDRRKQGILLATSAAPAALLIGDDLPAVVVPILLAWWAVIGWLSLSALLAGIALALPLYYAPLHINSGDFILSELMLISAIGVFALKLIVDNNFSPGRLLNDIMDYVARLARSPLVLIAATLAVVGIILAIFPADPSARAASLREWRWVLLEPLLFVVLLISVVRSRGQAWLIAAGYIAGAILAALPALVDPINGGGVAVEGLTRLEGFFPHPNAMALYLLRATVFVGFLTLWRFRRQPWAYVMLGLLLVILGGTFARSALVAIAIFMIIATRWMSAQLRRLTIAGIATAAAGLLIFARDRMLGGSESGSLLLRFDIWRSGLEMIRDRPVTGYGPDQFLYAYAPRYIQPAAWAERFTSHAHNLFIDGWTRLGVIGAFVFIVAAIVIGIRVLGIVKRGPAGDYLGSAAILALGAALCQALVDNGFFVHDVAMSAWLLAWFAFAAPTVMARRDELTDARTG